jgi:hypothetical protein
MTLKHNPSLVPLKYEYKLCTTPEQSDYSCDVSVRWFYVTVTCKCFYLCARCSTFSSSCYVAQFLWGEDGPLDSVEDGLIAVFCLAMSF